MARAAKQNSTTGTAPDPIFAAIENHKKLDHAWLAFAAELDEKQIGAKKKKKKKKKKNGKRTNLVAMRYELERAQAAELNAAWQLAKTAPSTPAGAGAFLSYIAIEMFSAGEMDWHPTAIDTMAPWKRHRRSANADEVLVASKGSSWSELVLHAGTA